MSLPIFQDQANNDDYDDGIIYFKSSEIVDEETRAAATHNHNQPPCNSSHINSPTSNLLQLCTLCTTADFDLNLGLIAQQLEDSLDIKTLPYAPQYAVRDITTDDKESTTPGNDLQHDIANHLNDDDHSVHGEQVNC